jgi:hypothetical protein
MKKSILHASLALFVALAITACGGEAPASTSATAVPAGEPAAAPTSAPPTEVPPTEIPPTEVPPTATPAPSLSAKDAIAAAREKSKEIESYQLEMKMTMQGALGEGLPGADPTQEIEAINLSGKFDGQNSEYTMKGFFAAFLGVEPDTGLQIISVDGQNYIHGPVPMIGAAEDKWYIADEAQSSLAEPPISTGDMLEGFDDASIAGLKSDGQEQLDGQQCQVFSGDKEATLKLLEGTGSSTPTTDMFEEVEDASTKLLICEDGYLHQMGFSVSGSAKDTPGQKASFSLNMHIFDFGGDFTITAPEGAVKLEMPQFNLPTTTP